MRLTLLATTMILAALPAKAATGLWAMTADSGSCEVSFVPEQIDDGIFFVDRGEADCGADIGRVTGYSLNEDGAMIVLYSTLDGVELLGTVAKAEAGGFEGSFKSGVKVRLDHVSGPKEIANPIAGSAALESSAVEGEEPAEEPAAALDCLKIAGSETCAEEADMGAPQGTEIKLFTRMNLRDQGTTSGSSVVGRAEAGQCMSVTFCSDDENGRLWCGVNGGGLSGYVLKQDDKTVYAANSC